MGGTERGREGHGRGRTRLRGSGRGLVRPKASEPGRTRPSGDVGGAERGREGVSGAERGPEGWAGSNAAGRGGRCPPRKAASWSQLAQRKRRCYQSCRRDCLRPALLEEEQLRLDSFLWIPQGYMPIFL